MNKLTRRVLLKQTSAGAATLTALVALPGFGAAHAATSLNKRELTALSGQGPLVAHVRNAATGEIAIMLGTREVVVHDKSLVAHLLNTLH